MSKSKERERPILNSSITFVKPTPSFIQKLINPSAPTVQTKFEKTDIPEGDIYKADEEPIYDAPEELVKFFKIQQGIDIEEKVNVDNNEVEVNSEQFDNDEKNNSIGNEVEDNDEKTLQKKRKSTSDLLLHKNIKKKSSGVQFSSTKSKTKESSFVSGEVHVVKEIKPKKNQKEKEKETTSKLSFNFDD